MNELTYKTIRLIDIENKPVVPNGERVGGKYWEFGINRYRLLYIQLIKNKGLMYSTGAILNISQ